MTCTILAVTAVFNSIPANLKEPAEYREACDCLLNKFMLYIDSETLLTGSES